MCHSRRGKIEYPLEAVAVLIGDPQTRRITGAAMRTAIALDVSEGEIVTCVRTLTPADFYRCIASEHDHRLWLDVYHPSWKGVRLYVKLYIETTGDGKSVVVLSFKER